MITAYLQSRNAFIVGLVSIPTLLLLGHHFIDPGFSLFLCLSLFIGICYLFRGFLLKNSEDLKSMRKKIVNLELSCFTHEALLKQIVSAGNELITEMEKDALKKKIRDLFASITKASAGYLLEYNQNKGTYEWMIGLSLNPLKLKSESFNPNDPLLGKILASVSPIQIMDLDVFKQSGILHVREDIVQNMHPKPSRLITIRMKMKQSILGVKFLFVTETQAKDIESNIEIFQSLVHLTTLALGSAVQREFAINDRMTMMYNHEYFVSRLKEEIAFCERSRNHKLTLLMMDIDHFKKFNDTYGHQIGDFVLIEAANIYKSCVRVSDIVARYGGEEFAIILPDTGIEDGILVAEKIRKSVESHDFKTDKGDLKVTVSIGVCEWKRDSANPLNEEAMVKLADDKLYECKRGGRNCVRY